MKITASIVAYNNEDEIANVLTSLANCNISDFEVYVVDNASKDGTVKLIEEQFSWVKLIRSPENVGFGAGHNLALKETDSIYHIFINPDILVEKGEIEKMISYMEENQDVVILSPRVLNTDGTEQYLPKKNPKIKYFLGGRFEKRSKICYRWRSEYTLRDQKIIEPTEVDFCTGCFMFCRTKALKSCGGFDERYFLHFEDADLTREMKKIGKTMYIPYIHVVHEWKRENGKSGKVFRIALSSMFKYLWKWRKG